LILSTVPVVGRYGLRVDSVSDEVGGDFELLASSLRASSGDLATYLRVLAEKLEEALPQAVSVRRRRAGFLSGGRSVVALNCDIGNERYGLALAGGRPEATRGSVVRGIVLKTESLPLESWVDALAAALAAEARSSEQARLAVERLLIG
jgi:hypothetical protein